MVEVSQLATLNALQGLLPMVILSTMYARIVIQNAQSVLTMETPETCINALFASQDGSFMLQSKLVCKHVESASMKLILTLAINAHLLAWTATETSLTVSNVTPRNHLIQLCSLHQLSLEERKFRDLTVELNAQLGTIWIEATLKTLLANLVSLHAHHVRVDLMHA